MPAYQPAEELGRDSHVARGEAEAAGDDADCMQSDWMIGLCAAEHGVLAVRSEGCGACSVGLGDNGTALALLTRLRAGCAFAHYTAPLPATFEPSVDRRVWTRHALAPAVTHIRAKDRARVSTAAKLSRKWMQKQTRTPAKREFR